MIALEKRSLSELQSAYLAVLTDRANFSGTTIEEEIYRDHETRAFMLRALPEDHRSSASGLVISRYEDRSFSARRFVVGAQSVFAALLQELREYADFTTR